MHALFEFFDTNENETVDLLELLGGFSQMCRGTHDERVLALFKTFDRHEQGEFNMDDFMGVMCFVYRSILTIQLSTDLKNAGVRFHTIDDLAFQTAREMFGDSCQVQIRRKGNHYGHGFGSARDFDVDSYDSVETEEVGFDAPPPLIYGQLGTLIDPPVWGGGNAHRTVIFKEFENVVVSTPKIAGFSKSTLLRTPFICLMRRLMSSTLPELLSCSADVK
eukprot:GHVN01106376.1.p4 GENE.GHVN01106376.1~~GHVN01106376.1.p4  ORF type:complete len:220 (-),score=29.73 GHVN01106376.1:2236-2895(-)